MANRDLIAESRERFIAETAEHELEILRDDGLYRHLRFRKPGTVIYSFDLVTWPGHLAITGDCSDFLFARIPDMFSFFAPEGRSYFDDEGAGINPDYWSEKLLAPRPPAGVEEYDYRRYRQIVEEWLSSVAEELPEEEAASLRAAVASQLLSEMSDAAYSEQEAHRLLNEFEHAGIRIADSWEWDLRSFRYDFLWCCWAVVWGIERYRSAVSADSPVVA